MDSLGAGLTRTCVLATATGAAATLLLVWRCWRREQPERFREVPGVPLLGVLPQLLRTGEMVEVLERWARDHGDEGVFEFTFLGHRIVCCCRWQECQEVLVHRPFRVTRPSMFRRVGLVESLDSVFFAEGKQWSLQRRLVAPAFSASSMDRHLPALHDIVDTFMAQIDAAVATRRPVDAGSLCRRFTADVISKVAFGQDFGSLQNDSTDLSDITTVMDSLALRAFSPVPYWRVPLLAWLDGADGALARLQLRMRRLLDSALERGEQGTLLAKLAAAEGEKLTQRQLVGNLALLFLAGTDTTSHTLAWALYELSLRPELQEALAQEVQSVAPGPIDAEQLRALSLTQAFWLEALRLRSVVPFLGLETQESITLAGRQVPPGTLMWLLTREVMRNAKEVSEVLGADLDEFRPARWLDTDGRLLACPPFDALAFGHGPRICLGRALANLEGPLVVAELLRRFRIHGWKGPELRERTSFVQMAARPVELHFERRVN